MSGDCSAHRGHDTSCPICARTSYGQAFKEGRDSILREFHAVVRERDQLRSENAEVWRTVELLIRDQEESDARFAELVAKITKLRST